MPSKTALEEEARLTTIHANDGHADTDLSAQFKEGQDEPTSLTAWLQVLGGHLVIFNSWGYITSFGVFQAYYMAALQRPPSDISWIGSIQAFLLFFLGIFSGRATDAGYYRHVMVAGSILQLIGVFMASLATQYWQIVLTQGLCVGVGNGLVFCPTITLISTYFVKGRALPNAVIANGSVTGGIVFTVIARQLLYRIGFPGTMRVMGYALLASWALALSLLRARPSPRPTGHLLDISVLREPTYTVFGSGMFLAFGGVFFAYFYVAHFAEDKIGLSPSNSLNLLMIMNAVGVPGRIVPALLADWSVGPINTLAIFVACSGILVCCWAAIKSLSSLWGFAILYGFFGAGVQGLFPPALGSLTTDPSKVGIQIGMVFSFVSLGCLMGPPIAGALIQVDDGGYLYAQLFGGLMMLCGSALLILSRVIKTRPHLWSRA